LRRYCATPGCPVIVDRGHCALHERVVDRDRPNAAVRRLYHRARWRHPVWGRRAQTLLRDPLCVRCLEEGETTPSTEVDHVVPHRGDLTLFWSADNLAGLCRRHHAEKTGRGQ
jgi:5-methylcytosine-specific restriction protein A